MEGNDFLGEDISSNVQRYEKMIRNKTQDYFDVDAIEGIIDYYIQHGKYKRAMQAVAFGQELYHSHVNFIVKLAEIYVLQEDYNLAQAELDKAELYEPFNPDLFLLKGEVSLNLGKLEESEYYFERALMHSDERLDMLFEISGCLSRFLHEQLKDLLCQSRKYLRRLSSVQDQVQSKHH